jgi:hypothetical protein
MDTALRKHLAAGHPLAYAAALAGIPYPQAHQQLIEATDDSDLDAQRLALSEHAHEALATIRDLLGAEDERVRLGAAKAILELQVKHKPKAQRVAAEVGEDLWSCAAKRGKSENRDRNPQSEPPGLFDIFEGSLEGEEIFEALDTTDHGPEATHVDQTREPPKLTSCGVASAAFKLDSSHSAKRGEKQQQIGPVL